MREETTPITQTALSGFYGSESFFRHLAKDVIYTEGCAYLYQNGAAWLIDAIAFAQSEVALRGEEFQSWTLRVNQDERTATLEATDGGIEISDEGRAIYKKLYFETFPYTDFPLPELRLYVCANGLGENGKTILLASEY